MATGNGKSTSNLGASSSNASKKPAKQEKRKQRATRAEKAKKPRPSQLINLRPHPGGNGSGTAVHRGASNNMATAAAIPFPMAGVNGAAPLWSTAATLGAAASRAAALTLSSVPATATAGGANGHATAPVVIAPAPSPQSPPAGAAASNAAALLAATTGIMPPLVFAQAGGQLVPLPLHFVGYHAPCRAGANGQLPAPAVGIPLAVALDKIENGALARMLSALMPRCHPPLWQHQSKTGLPPPPWWPTGSEHWWKHELLDNLDAAAALTSVPFASTYSLRKAQKVAVLVAIVKHLAPDFANIAAAVWKFGKLSVSETKLWLSALNNERAKFMRPPVFVLLQPQQQGGAGAGASATTDPGAAGTGNVVVVHSGNNAASDGCGELQQVANLPAGASVSAPAAVVGRGGEVVAAEAELVEKEQRRDSDGGGGVVSAADALLAGHGNFPAGDDIHNQGASVAAPAGHVRPVAAEPEQHGDNQDGNDDDVATAEDEQAHDSAGVVCAADAPAGDDGRDQHVNNFPPGGDGRGPPEMTTMQPEQDGGVPGDDVAAAAAEDEQVHPEVAPNPNAVAAIEEEAPDDHQCQWWCNSEEDELNRMLAEYESFGDAIWY